MTPKEARNAIQEEYLTAAVIAVDHIALDNQDFDPPDDETPWVRLHIKFNDGGQDSLGKSGNRKFGRVGFVYIQVFTKKGGATNANDDLANNSLDVFDGERLGDLWFFNGRIETIGSGDVWYRQNVVIEFKFENIR